MATKVSGSSHSPHVGIELRSTRSPTLKFMGFARLYCCLYFFCAVLMLAAANSLADNKESTSSSRYSLRSTGAMDSVGKNAASVGDQQSTPNNKFKGFSLVASCDRSGKYRSHWLSNLTACLRSMLFSVLFNRRIGGGMQWC